MVGRTALRYNTALMFFRTVRPIHDAHGLIQDICGLIQDR
jgi:hypothetical protein